MGREVVVTGLGVISAVGSGKVKFWTNLLQGNSGISKIELFDTSQFRRHYGGEIKNFDLYNFVPRTEVESIGRASQFAIAATTLALQDAELSYKAIQSEKTALIMGTTLPEGNTVDFCMEMLLKESFDNINENSLMMIFSPSTPSYIARYFSLKGINMLIPNACAAGNYAIAYGSDLIKNGDIDIALVGGFEALSRVSFQGFQRLGAMAPQVCSPFDKNRKGMLLSEGAGILILESKERAKKRSAHIYAKVLGYGLSCDASHIVIPQRAGIRKAIQNALGNSGVSMNEVDYICAHGSGTIQNDKEEASAIKELLGSATIPVSSIKSMLGHAMGAASAIEAVSCCLSIEHNIIPPTLNYETPDPECDIDCVPNKPREQKVNIALNNAFAFGGNNCCVVFSKD
jgi:3-oxoacyl-[acyl-carrier-protein] synthase II